MGRSGPWSWLCFSLLVVGSFKVLDVAAAAQSIVFSVELQEKRSCCRVGKRSRVPFPDPSLYYRPVIGILSHPGDGASGRLSNATDASYIAASYVKFVESAGARVIPLIFNEPRRSSMKWVYSSLFPVSSLLALTSLTLFRWAKRGLYYDTAQDILQKVLEMNDAGKHFPLFAICLGFEIVSIMISKDEDILEHFSGTNQASTLTFAEDMAFQGTIFQRFPPSLLAKLSKECLVMQNHKVPTKSHLSSFFKILTTSTDDEGQVYVSTVQAHGYPITGFQWHPEKNAFEWGVSAIPHSEDAVQVTQHAANYFISEARKSSNRPPAGQVLANLIYNFRATYCGKAGKGYDEVYIFS
ncbi:unnamed protein product [Spirodela intermedia]|uniref:folate gamma-glutamyl hydrolase n=1 Tax=Spirodela intermedia TaxID=51605 RepID=A0A7I8IU40_SPIIN|nr:unnamed protein product [Spirodela intermedia]CAA6661139.1 unnamed protein product [Spirodela intermedia]